MYWSGGYEEVERKFLPTVLPHDSYKMQGVYLRVEHRYGLLTKMKRCDRRILQGKETK